MAMQTKELLAKLLKVRWFHSFIKEATLLYLLLFRFSPVPSLDLGTRSLVSGGEL